MLINVESSLESGEVLRFSDFSFACKSFISGHGMLSDTWVIPLKSEDVFTYRMQIPARKDIDLRYNVVYCGVDTSGKAHGAALEYIAVEPYNGMLRLLAVHNFENNVKQGYERQFDEKGNLATVTLYSDGLKNGRQFFLTSDRNVYRIAQFAYGKENGLTQAFHRNGMIKEEIDFKKGFAYKIRQFDKEGKITSAWVYQMDGRSIKQMFADNALSVQIPYIGSSKKKNGIAREYDESGKLVTLTMWKNDRKDREASVWLMNRLQNGTFNDNKSIICSLEPIELRAKSALEYGIL